MTLTLYLIRFSMSTDQRLKTAVSYDEEQAKDKSC